jgi:hypothetical protein
MITIKNNRIAKENPDSILYNDGNEKQSRCLMNELWIPAEKVNVVESVDVCVIGGSCTGVFAALRAARLGARVALVERQNRFGGVAVSGLVGMWHSLFDMTESREIIGGLTREIVERLEKRGAVSDFRCPVTARSRGVRFNSEELALELDRMVEENRNIRVFLQTACSRPVMTEDGRVEAVVAEDKSGRLAIRARVFVDASGDGVLCRDAGLKMRLPDHPQPPTACARFSGWENLGPFSLKDLIDKYRDKYPGLPGGYCWGMPIPGSRSYMLAGTRVLNCDCSRGDEISRAELESRRQIRAIMDMLRDEFPGAEFSLESLPSAIGIRESLHIESIGAITGEELLKGTRFPDAIANGTYPVDIHNDEDESIAFKRLDGGFQVFKANQLIESGRWLPEGEVLPFYQIPLSSLVPAGAANIIAAGRMLDADREAFGAVRVMVNLNQCGEAAGVAAWQCVNHDCRMDKIDAEETRRLLAKGGSIMI